MRQDCLEAGQVVGTHGVRGEVKIVPWADSPEFLCALKTLYADGDALAVRSARVHKGGVIIQFEGVDSVEDAMRLRGRVLSLKRSDVKLPPGSVFQADLIGLRVVDEAGHALGTLREVLSPSRQQVYVVEGEREILIPAVPEFILETNMEGGYIRVRLLEGM